jgi:hypothetical protein
MTEIYTLYELDKYIGMTNVKINMIEPDRLNETL